VGFDVTHGQAPLAALLKEVGTEPADPRQKVGKIDFAFLVEPLFQVYGRQFFDDFVHPLGCGKGAVDGDQLPVDSKNDGISDFDMDVGGGAINRRFQNAMKVFHETSLAKRPLEPRPKRTWKAGHPVSGNRTKSRSDRKIDGQKNGSGESFICRR